MPSRLRLLWLLLPALFLTACPSPKEGGGADGDATSAEPLSAHPVGTGPFVFKLWKRDQKIILTANPNYWGGKPKVERLIMQPIVENSTRLARLEAGDAHILDGLRPPDAKALEGNKDIVVMRQPGMNMGYLAMNVEKAPFDDVRVRKAVALAIDKAKIVELNFQGYGQPAVNPVPPTMPGADDSASLGAPQLEAARALLKEAGVSLPIKTELWHMPIPRPYMPEPQKIALLIKEALGEIGIEAELVSRKWEFYLKETKEGKHPMCLLGWTADVADPDNFLYVLLGKDNIGSTNVSRYANEAVNAKLIEAQSTLDDAAREALYKEVQATIREEAPMVPLVHADQLMAYRKGVDGFFLHPTARKDFESVTFSGGDAVVFAKGGEASKLDPALVDDGESVVVCTSVYEPLVKYERGSSKIVPCLATEWKRSDDGLTWTFKLREGVSFHDGTPFDADAVIVNFKRLYDTSDPYHDLRMQNLNLYAAIDAVEKLGSHEVAFKLSRPVATFLGNLTIYTAHIASPKAIRASAKADK